VVTKIIFSVGPTAVKFRFTNSKLKENHFSTETLTGKYKTSKSREDSMTTLHLPSDTHENKEIYVHIRQPTVVPQ